MYFSSPERTFGISHPLGLPRPIDPDNFFGAKSLFFARNMMPVPTGCLAHFDVAVYRPYLRRLVEYLCGAEFGWEGPGFLDDPPRYCLVRDGVPSAVPADLRPLMPEPPRVRVGDVFRHFDCERARGPGLQLLDILTLISEDLGSDRFAAETSAHPWVAEFMR